MQGVKLARIAHLFGRAFLMKGLFGRRGAVSVICSQIEKACLENDIAMVKALLRTISAQDIKAFEEIRCLLEKELSKDELAIIFPKYN